MHSLAHSLAGAAENVCKCGRQSEVCELVTCMETGLQSTNALNPKDFLPLLTSGCTAANTRLSCKSQNVCRIAQLWQATFTTPRPLHPWTGHISSPIQHRHPGGTGTKHNLIEFYSTSGLVTKTQLSERLHERPVRDYAFFNRISKCSARNESHTHTACGLTVLLTFKALPFASDTRKRSEESQYCLSPFLAWCFFGRVWLWDPRRRLSARLWKVVRRMKELCATMWCTV